MEAAHVVNTVLVALTCLLIIGLVLAVVMGVRRHAGAAATTAQTQVKAKETFAEQEDSPAVAAMKKFLADKKSKQQQEQQAL